MPTLYVPTFTIKKYTLYYEQNCSGSSPYDNFKWFCTRKKEKPEGNRQQHKTETVTPEEQSKQLGKELGLDSKQQEKVKILYTEQEKQRAASKQEDSRKGEKVEKPNRDGADTKMKKENDAFDSKMKGILTPEQYTKWQASQKKGKGGPEKEGGKKPQKANKES